MQAKKKQAKVVDFFWEAVDKMLLSAGNINKSPTDISVENIITKIKSLEADISMVRSNIDEILSNQTKKIRILHHMVELYRDLLNQLLKHISVKNKEINELQRQVKYI